MDPDAIEQDVSDARTLLTELEKHGVSLNEITDELVKDGVQQFADAFDKLFGTIAKRRHTLRDGERAGLEIALSLPEMKTAVDAEMEGWRKGGRIRRLWAGDKSLWTGSDEDKWAGWLHIVEQELADLDRLSGFTEQVKEVGFTDVLLLGMGGSSLGPEVLGETFGRQAGWPALPHAGQHGSGANQGDRAGGRSRQDTIHCVFQIGEHAGAQHLPRLFFRSRRRL